MMLEDNPSTPASVVGTIVVVVGPVVAGTGGSTSPVHDTVDYII